MPESVILRSDGGLLTAALGGIIAGSVAAFLLLILCIFLLVHRRQRAHLTFKSPAHDNLTYTD
jgi:hypothetical protein